MARPVSANSLAALNQNLGTEPVVIVEIQWVEGGSVYTYSDKNINSDEGKILEVGELDNTVTIQGVSAGTTGDVQQIRITLDDVSGEIKSIIDQHDIHKRPAWIYQWFNGMDLDDKFLLFKGQISSPILWNEKDRTIAFDVISRIEDAEVGFSMEEGDFPSIPEELVGQSWPLVFGTVENMPALRTQTPRKGVLRQGVGIRDFMLGPKIEQLELVCCPSIVSGFNWISTGPTNVWGASGARKVYTFIKDAACECNKAAQLRGLRSQLAKHVEYENATVTISGGGAFQQGVLMTFDMKGAKVSGYFNGTPSAPSETFVITNREHPTRATTPIPEIKSFGCPPLPYPADDPNYRPPSSLRSGAQRCIITEDGETLTGDGDPTSAAYAYLARFQEAGFFWAEVGTEVSLVNDTEISYVVNLLPSTILRVSAYRNFSSGIRQLSTVPANYYSTRISDFNGYLVTEVVLNRALSTIPDEGWDDDIYVSHTSSVGPNTVDILEWIIDKYTEFSVDESTFDDLRTKLDNYPMNFVVPGRPNVLQLLQEIAFQARCALVLRNDVFFLYYLSEEPNEDGTITESDVLTSNGLVLDHTSTEELVTKLTAEWKSDLSRDKPNKVIVRHNIKQYGTQAETFDFYCFNIQELVLKSATFWLIRMANTWRKIRCSVPIKHLQLESLDGVYINLPDIADGVIKCRVETAVYNSATREVDMEIWTPVKSGTRVPYQFAYPAYVEETLLFPTVDEFQSGAAGGSGPNVDVKAPQGHVLGEAPQVGSTSVDLPDPCSPFAGISSLASKCRNDQGDKQPSDLGDKKPQKSVGTGGGNPPSQSPQKTFTLNEFGQLVEKVSNLESQQAQQQGQLNTQGTETQASQNPQDDQPDGEDLPECKYGARFNFSGPVFAVYTDNGGLVTINQDPGATGRPATFGKPGNPPGSIAAGSRVDTFETYWFCSRFERDSFLEAATKYVLTPVQNGAPSVLLSASSLNAPNGSGCSPNACEEGQEGIIGYDATNKGQSGRTDTLVNYGGSKFLTSEVVDNDGIVVRPPVA